MSCNEALTNIKDNGLFMNSWFIFSSKGATREVGGEECLRRASADSKAAATEIGLGILYPQVAGHDTRLGGDIARQGLRVRTGKEGQEMKLIFLNISI